jgi:hypothetical protein
VLVGSDKLAATGQLQAATRAAQYQDQQSCVAAAASGKTESALASELLEVIARDNLFDAVLDVAT